MLKRQTWSPTIPRIFGCLPFLRTSPSRFFVAIDANVVAKVTDVVEVGVGVGVGVGGVGVGTVTVLVVISVGLFATWPFQLVTTGTPPPRGLPTIPKRRRFPDWASAAKGFPLPTPTLLEISSPNSEHVSPNSVPPFESSPARDDLQLMF